MDQYVGLDVSQDETHICAVDRDGNKLWEGSCASTPKDISAAVKKHAHRCRQPDPRHAQDVRHSD